MHDPQPRRPLGARTVWWTALLAVIAVDYLVLGIGASGSSRLLALAGAALTGTAALTAIKRRPRPTIGLVALGSLPLAVSTPWSIVTPVLAAVAVSVALAAAWHLHRLEVEPVSPPH
jgi:hypothetical protein